MSTAVNRPNLIARGATLAGTAIIIAALALLALGGGTTYRLNLELPNASGLRPGSQVLLGGVSVGAVQSLNLNRQNVVVADLHLDPKLVHIGRGASASIVAANLLGEKYVSLHPGDLSAPLADGTTLPQSATTLPTDLDQIVGVLDDPTRADLATLLNEAGRAVAGRRSDVSAILRQFPLSLDAATKLLTTMVQDNHTLAGLVSNSNQFIDRINGQSGDLKQAIDASAGAVTTLALKTSQLRNTVRGLPGVARSFTNTFVEGRNALMPLIPAARQITTAAPLLNQLLHAVKPFTHAAVPTLNRAAAVSPALETLADKATPTVKLAVPTLASLENIAKVAAPLSSWLGLSSQDLFGIFQGWTRAIQFRDGLSHVFNGDIYLSPNVVLNTANTGATAAQRRQNLLDIKNPDILRTLGLTAAYNRAKAYRPPALASKRHKPVSLPKVTLPKIKVMVPKLTGHQPTGSATQSVRNLLSGVLGALGGGHSGGASGSSGGSSGTGSADASSLNSLLSYLLGR